jgi:uncharacterized protein with HEPN domain
LSPRGDVERLNDILVCIERIGFAELALADVDASQEPEDFQLIFDSILYNLVIIGEAVNSLSDGVQSVNPEIPWKDIVSMRNILAHRYFQVSAKVIKATIDQPLKELAKVCQSELDSFA